jgi:hypothetical protein
MSAVFIAIKSLDRMKTWIPSMRIRRDELRYPRSREQTERLSSCHDCWPIGTNEDYTTARLRRSDFDDLRTIHAKPQSRLQKCEMSPGRREQKIMGDERKDRQHHVVQTRHIEIGINCYHSGVAARDSGTTWRDLHAVEKPSRRAAECDGCHWEEEKRRPGEEEMQRLQILARPITSQM